MQGYSKYSQLYIECVAEDVRTELERKSILSPDDNCLPIEKLKTVVEFFKGKLEKDTNSEHAYIKKNKNGFTIYYNEKSTYFHILHELGHAIFDLNDIDIGGEMRCEGSTEADVRAEIFATCFAMSRNSFSKAVIRNTKNGICDINKVAELYDVDYSIILARGEELDIWGR